MLATAGACYGYSDVGYYDTTCDYATSSDNCYSGLLLSHSITIHTMSPMQGVLGAVLGLVPALAVLNW